MWSVNAPDWREDFSNSSGFSQISKSKVTTKKRNYSVHLQHREIIVDTANVVTKLCAQ